MPNSLEQGGKAIDPADELMDYLGLPREEGKLALWEAALDVMPLEFWGRLLETTDE